MNEKEAKEMGKLAQDYMEAEEKGDKPKMVEIRNAMHIILYWSCSGGHWK